VKPVELDRLAPLQSRVETVHGQYVQAQDASGLHRLLRMNDGAGTANAFLIPFDENFGARLRSVQRLHQRLTANSSTALPSGSQLSRIQRARLVLFVRALKDPKGVQPKARVEISPDGMRWMPEGAEAPMPDEATKAAPAASS